MNAPKNFDIAIKASQINAYYGSRQVLKDVSLEIKKGLWTSIIGPNGAGKSTLLSVLAGLHACSGNIELLGKNIYQWPSQKKAQELSWLGQKQSSADDLLVYDVVMLGRLPFQGWLANASAQDVQAVEQAMRMTQCWDWRKRPLGSLSGGERQRVLLARVLSVQAQVILMDEPLANLDPPHQADWLKLTRELVSTGKTVISVLHEISIALHADEMIIVSDGQIQHHGQCQDTSTHKALENVFENRVSVQAIGAQWIALPCL
jgi:iron complex transport system ATP-binding protein